MKLIFAALLGVALARPQQQYQQPQQQQQQQYQQPQQQQQPQYGGQQSGPPVEILEYEYTLNGDGSYNFHYRQSDDQYRRETGVQIPGPPSQYGDEEEDGSQVVEGEYSYTDAYGQEIKVTYIADDNGFRAEGDHLPTPPPIPQEIAEALAALDNQPQASQQYQQPAAPQQQYQRPAAPAPAPPPQQQYQQPAAPEPQYQQPAAPQQQFQQQAAPQQQYQQPAAPEPQYQQPAAQQQQFFQPQAPQQQYQQPRFSRNSRFTRKTEGAPRYRVKYIPVYYPLEE